jgi:hypothetical protein
MNQPDEVTVTLTREEAGVVVDWIIGRRPKDYLRRLEQDRVLHGFTGKLRAALTQQEGER